MEYQLGTACRVMHEFGLRNTLVDGKQTHGDGKQTHNDDKRTHGDIQPTMTAHRPSIIVQKGTVTAQKCRATVPNKTSIHPQGTYQFKGDAGAKLYVGDIGGRLLVTALHAGAPASAGTEGGVRRDLRRPRT